MLGDVQGVCLISIWVTVVSESINKRSCVGLPFSSVLEPFIVNVGNKVQSPQVLFPDDLPEDWQTSRHVRPGSNAVSGHMRLARFQ